MKAQTGSNFNHFAKLRGSQGANQNQKHEQLEDGKKKGEGQSNCLYDSPNKVQKLHLKQKFKDWKYNQLVNKQTGNIAHQKPFLILFSIEL